MKIYGEKSKYVVISASRMTDMPEFYPARIISETEKRREKGLVVHTLVLWTKHPSALFREPLSGYLKKLSSDGSQIFLQLTITGMGGARQLCDVSGKPLCGIDGRPFSIEPFSPPVNESLAMMERVVEALGSPERIRLRFDPIVRIADSRGSVYSNSVFMPVVIEKASAAGVKNFTFSFLEKGMHAKVDRRFSAIGCSIIPPTFTERAEFGEKIREYESKFGVSISACCVEGFDDSRCIDGALLSGTHEGNVPAAMRELRRRPKCGCTESIDIGGWPPLPCANGCLYCYSNPAIAIR